jgi:ketosteroid isomerase-like protein
MMMRLAAGLFAIAAFTLPASAQAPSPRASLIQADHAASQAVLHHGIIDGLNGVLDDGAVFLYEGAPVTSGKERIIRLLTAQRSLIPLRMQWFPVIIAISQDGDLGVTSGATTIAVSGQPADSALHFGHYIAAWRRVENGPWRIVALLENGLADPDSLVLPEPWRSDAGPVAISAPGRPFAQADLEFARLAADSGAPLAFYRWAAPDVTTPPGTGIMVVGPAAMRARMEGGPLARAAWEWHPVWGAAAESGDLAVTVGLSKISTGSDAYIGKYLTVWRRQPDGSVRFILDSGNDRPK